jgi:hypothetical protein
MCSACIRILCSQAEGNVLLEASPLAELLRTLHRRFCSSNVPLDWSISPHMTNQENDTTLLGFLPMFRWFETWMPRSRWSDSVGLCYRRDSELCCNLKELHTDFDNIPVPTTVQISALSLFSWCSHRLSPKNTYFWSGYKSILSDYFSQSKANWGILLGGKPHWKQASAGLVQAHWPDSDKSSFFLECWAGRGYLTGGKFFFSVGRMLGCPAQGWENWSGKSDFSSNTQRCNPIWTTSQVNMPYFWCRARDI